MATKSKSKICPDDWSYFTEGNANIVLCYTGTNPELKGKLLRIRKIDNESSSRNESKIRILDYHVLLRKIVGEENTLTMEEGVADESTLRMIASEISGKRPKQRLSREIDFDHPSVYLIKDARYSGSSKAISVEFKPKGGFLNTKLLSSNGVRDLTHRNCRLCLYKHLRFKGGISKDIERYCPSLLFSNRKLDIDVALMHLFNFPEPFFRYHGTDQTMLTNNDRVRRMVATVLYENTILSRLLEVYEAVDILSIEDVLDAFKRFCTDHQKSNADVSVEPGIEHFHDSVCEFYKRCTQGLAPADDLQILIEYVISRTLRDISIVVSLSHDSAVLGENSEGESSWKRYTLEENVEFYAKLVVIDLDYKPFDKIPQYCKKDLAIVQSYLKTT